MGVHNTHKLAHKPFSALGSTSAPSHLRSLIRARVGHAQRRRRTVRLAFFGALEALSVAAFILSGRYALEALSSSGIYSYASLVFSEGVGLFSYLEEFAYSLLESLPTVALAATFAAMLAIGWSTTRIRLAINPSI